MVDVFTYLVRLPDQIDEMVVPCADGFTVYISVNLDEFGRLRAFNHAMRHILRDDFNGANVGEIEQQTHDDIGGKQ